VNATKDVRKLLSSIEILSRLDTLEAQDEAAADARAVGWVTISTDLSIGSMFVVGFYPTLADAEEAAADQQDQMDEFTDSAHPGWYVKAYRVMPKEDS